VGEDGGADVVDVALGQVEIGRAVVIANPAIQSGMGS
jgi:hypothetical protein